MSTVYALRAYYPGNRVAIAGEDDTVQVLAQEKRFYREHADAIRIDRHVLPMNGFRSFSDYPGDGTNAQLFAEWALLPDGWELIER